MRSIYREMNSCVRPYVPYGTMVLQYCNTRVRRPSVRIAIRRTYVYREMDFWIYPGRVKLGAGNSCVGASLLLRPSVRPCCASVRLSTFNEFLLPSCTKAVQCLESDNGSWVVAVGLRVPQTNVSFGEGHAVCCDRVFARETCKITGGGNRHRQS